jgi:hypothetical protein
MYSDRFKGLVEYASASESVLSGDKWMRRHLSYSKYYLQVLSAMHTMHCELLRDATSMSLVVV